MSGQRVSVSIAQHLYAGLLSGPERYDVSHLQDGMDWQGLCGGKGPDDDGSVAEGPAKKQWGSTAAWTCR